MPTCMVFPYNHSMPESVFPHSLEGTRAHFVGAKGTGMAALAEIFASKGAILSGSDVPDHFYTDAILASIGMKLYESFDRAHVDETVELVVYSAAYDPATNPELVEARRRGLPLFSYPQALGELSRRSDSSGVAGVHGKTTTTAMVGSILGALGCPATILAGSAVSSFKDRSTLIGGDKYFVAETCEYRRHFLNFSPRRILLTSVESDHQDYYPTYKSIRDAFVEYALSLPAGGTLIYCADDAGASEVAGILVAARGDLAVIPYGFSAGGQWRIVEFDIREGISHFRVKADTTRFSLHVPGKHLVLDAVGALALAHAIMNDFNWEKARIALAEFRGSKRRSEIVGKAGDILIMDDYAHHPTALKATIAGIRAFWPSRRIIVDFMSHTYSRTMALMDEFAESLDKADCVILHGIYASVRESPIPGIGGRTLFEKVKARRQDLVDISDTPHVQGESLTLKDVLGENRDTAKGPPGFLLYVERHEDAAGAILPLLRENDLFITMGAGDNWKLGRRLLELLTEKENRRC